MDGVYLLGPPFGANGAAEGAPAERMRRLLEEAAECGWEEARQRFVNEVLSGTLAPRRGSRLARARAKLTGSTWEDMLQDLVDPTRAAWKFLLALRPGQRVLFLGPSWGAAPLALARGARHVVVLDGALERLRVVRQQAHAAGLDNLTCARLVDPLRLPLADESVELAVVPGLAEWFRAVAGRRRLPAACGTELLDELRRVLARGGQVYLAADNRWGLAWLAAARRLPGATFSAAALRAAAAATGFGACALYAPLPFRHKFHQVVDLGRTDRMNVSVDAYRTRGRALRPLVRLWDASNRGGALERRLYPVLPGLGAVLSTETTAEPLAETILHHLRAEGHIPPPARLSRYYVRPKGVAVLVAGSPGSPGGAIVRLPLDEQAESACARHHRAIETLAADPRIPAALRALFPRPLARGTFAGQVYFAESALAGEVGRVYYSRSARRYDRAILGATEVLCQLRRATEEPVTIGPVEFARLCGDWLGELRTLMPDEPGAALDVVERSLRDTLLGATLPLGWHHGDYDFANLLYGPRDEVTGILDFEVFDPRGLPLIDLVLLLARRPIRRQGFAFGTLFVRSILPRALPALEAKLLEREMRAIGVDDRLYRALALCCWLDHLRLRRDSWLVRSPSWLDDNLRAVAERVRTVL